MTEFNSREFLGNIDTGNKKIEARRELPLIITQIQVATFDEILARENTDATGLEETIKRKLLGMTQSSDKENIEFIDTLYNLRSLAESETLLLDWQEKLKSFDNFFAAFVPDASFLLQRSFRESMFHFVTQYQHPQRLISRSEFNLWRFNKLKDNAINIYEAGGDWVTIPTIP